MIDRLRTRILFSRLKFAAWLCLHPLPFLIWSVFR